MSLILDALNRSASDRSSPGDTPGLQSVHGPRDPSPEPRWRRLLWPSLAVLFGLVALGLWYTGKRESPAPPEGRAAVESRAPLPEVAPVAGKPVAGKPVAGKPAQEISNPEAPVAATQSVEAPPPAAPQAPVLDPDVAALYRQQEVSPPVEAPPAAATPAAAPAPQPAAAPAAAEPLDVDALTRAAETALAERSQREEPVVEHGAPFITELRQQTKDQIPTIFYSEHNWSSVASERSVVLNRERFTEGQQVKPGLRLLEILPDSIVLDFQGTEFRLQSLNSWVNL